MNSHPNSVKGSALTTLIGGIVILLAVLFFLVKLATGGYYSDVEDMNPNAVETRIKPAGGLLLGDGTPVGQREGKQVFDKVCIQCHGADSNVAFSPKITHNADWAPRIAKGFETLVKHAIDGFVGPQGGSMPARGGDTTLTDDEVARAVAYMANESGASFNAPAVQSEGGEAAASGEQSAAAGDSSATGKAVFDKLCVACHAANSTFPNSPKITHNDDWAPRIAQGRETLLKNAIQGFKTMPAKGGDPSLSDAEVEAAVAYMVNQSGGTF
ncbi:c-type cytochrome [Neisseria shayeganii]|uniref:Cytochrome c5 family protein n=1 Tax=Neisseria shayeganii TaxID=607712 RepID=A0A7D7S5K3_9NEIS|nr:c-type cytochrome [Neisseria shayeganii]QMT40926.1 cytochrome c5 family protein [Neisseria shayeganii]